MRQISPWRLGLVGAVTLLCLILIYPTFAYVLALGGAPADDSPDRAAWEEKTDKLRDKGIRLGLDLRGGVDVTLKIDEEKSGQNAVQSLVQTLKTEFDNEKISAEVTVVPDGSAFTVKVLDKASARAAFNVIEKYAPELEGDYSQGRLEAGEEVRLAVNADRVRSTVEGDIQGALHVIRERLDASGLTQPSIALQGQNQIRIQIAGEKDPERVIKNLTTLAQMEFRLAHERWNMPGDPLPALLDEKGELRPGAEIPLGYDLVEYRFGKFNPATKEREFETGKMLVEKETYLSGKNLRAAGVTRDQFDIENPIKVSLQFDNEGAEVFEKLTRESAEAGARGGTYRHLAVLLDGVCRTAPRLGVAIAGGNAVIEGGFSFEEAQDLAFILKAGSLPAPLKEESKRQVGATLGNESVLSGVRALIWGTLAVVVFMIAYYGMAGVIGVFALILNAMIPLAILALADATLTLSGIGGILLTVGMAVDANVLIYERIREEIDDGKPLKQAINTGFDRAFSVIWDTNLTTLMSALVLLQFTEGSVFGFALTMAFGLIANLFTGLTVTHTLCAAWFQWRGSLNMGSLRMFKNAAYDFIKLRYVSTGLSIGLLVLGIGLVAARGGLTMGVDFAGGLVAEVAFKEDPGETRLREVAAEANLDGARIQHVPGSNDYIIRVKELAAVPEGSQASGTLAATQEVLETALKAQFGEDGFQVGRISSVGPETGQGFQEMALWVTLLTAASILLFLWFRFELVFGVAAVIALIHDLLIAGVWSSVWGVEITLDVVAALMVLMGFSVNDTIVIFDRIRENANRHKEYSFAKICNLSVNQCISRTIITSGTVFLTVLMMYFVGGEGMRPLAKVMLIGCIAGTYSTTFIATPIVYEWNERRKNRLVTALRDKDKPAGPEAAKAPEIAPSGSKTVGNVPRRRAV